MWEHFFETSDTIGKNLGFKTYDRTHMIWLLVFFLLTVMIGLIYRRADEKKRERILWTVTVMTLCNELAKYIILTVGGNFTLEYLPLHMCSINIFVILAYAITKNETLAEVLYAVCLPGALVALLFPSWTKLPPTAFMHIHSFTVHIELFHAPFIILLSGFKPSFKRLTKAIPAILTAVICVYIWNKVFDTNFMFLNGAGKGNPLVYFEKALGDPLYLIAFPILISLVWGVMYGLPAIFAYYKSKKKKFTHRAA